jgi:hypothetical protein
MWKWRVHSSNKGLAGAPAEAIDAARNTAMNPAVVDAFALIICAAEGAAGGSVLKVQQKERSW